MSRASLPLATLLLGSCLVGPIMAQQHASSLQSYQRARRALDAGIAALGGLDKLRGIQTISVRHHGQSFWRNQSPKASPPFAATPTSGLLVLSSDGTRVVWDNETSYPGGFLNRNRLVVKDKDVWTENHVERRWTTIPSFTPANQAGFMRRFPHYILLNAFERAAQLRWLGEADVAGKKQDVITYSTDDGQQLTLYLDARTHLLTRWEQLFTDPQTGDALLEVAYPGYQEVAGVKIPTGRRLRRAGETAEDVSFTDVAINREIPESLLQKPSDYVDGSGGPQPDTTVAKLADDVYVVQGVGGGNNTLFVAFNEYVLAVEAYGNDAASQRTIAKIKATVPGKPIRYLVPTHHHDDHTGGVRGFIAEGTTIVTTPGNRRYFETMARAEYTIQPDSQSRRRQPLKLETIENKRRVFTDGAHTAEVIDIGPSPHADEMLVVYLPKERILVQGDLLNRTPDRRARAGNASTAHFLEWYQKSGLQVERFVPVHGPEHTLEDLKRAVEMMKE